LKPDISKQIKTNTMKKQNLFFWTLAVMAAFIITSCTTPITLTSWKNQADNSKVSKVVVMALFGKLEYTKPVEQYVAACFNRQGLKSIEALDFLNPTKKYDEADIKAKLDSLGADAMLVFTYKGTDVSQNYVPATYYGYCGGPWGYGYGGYYYGWGGGVTNGGYWSTTRIVNIKASLYSTQSQKAKGAIWTADITVTDPQYIDQAATNVAQQIYIDWQKNQLLK
jgi:hypothetical protein